MEATFGQLVASEVMNRQDKHAFQEAEPEFRALFIRTVSSATHHRTAFWKAFFMGAIQAIETTCYGFRFRSRLEARWAKLFRNIGFEFEYEPEGFIIKHGSKSWPWLPDFYLPETKTWVEIKGDWKSIDSSYLEMLAQSVNLQSAERNSENTTLPNIDVDLEERGNRREASGLLLLGNIPSDSEATPVFPVLRPSAPGVHLEFVEFWISGPTQAPDFGFYDLHSIVKDDEPADIARLHKLISRQKFNPNRGVNRMRDNFSAARQARYEHGESPR